MKLLLLASLTALTFSSPAVAQDDNDLRVRVGLGAQVKPAFVGSDDFELGPLLHFDLAHGSDPFKVGAPDDSFGIRLFSKGGFSFGP